MFCLTRSIFSGADDCWYSQCFPTTNSYLPLPKLLPISCRLCPRKADIIKYNFDLHPINSMTATTVVTAPDNWATTQPYNYKLGIEFMITVYRMDEYKTKKWTPKTHTYLEDAGSEIDWGRQYCLLQQHNKEWGCVNGSRAWLCMVMLLPVYIISKYFWFFLR